MKSVALTLGLMGAVAPGGVAHLRPLTSWRSSMKPGSWGGRLTMKLMAMLSTPRVLSKAISRM
jgi:hypothetical protein